jgi:hypothetical protein
MQAEINHVASVRLQPNSSITCPMPGEIPVMEKLHKLDKRRTDQNAATRFLYGQFLVELVRYAK